MKAGDKIEKNLPATMPQLRMDFGDLVHEGRTLRVFNGRGDVCPYEKTVTGIRTFNFPPNALDAHRFLLNFRDNESGLLVQDIEQDMLDLILRSGGFGHHPLGQNRETFEPFEKPGYEFRDEKGNYHLLIFQDSWWLPNEHTRIGGYHKFIADKWISFAIQTKLSVSDIEDAFYLEVSIKNRTDKVAEYTAVPYQYLNDDYHLNKKLDTTHTGFNNMRCKWAPSKKEYNIAIEANISEMNEEGYLLTLKPLETKTFVLKISVDEITAEKPFAPRASFNGEVAEELKRTKKATEESLAQMYEAMPKIKSPYENFERFYNTCIFNVWGCKWHRENFILDPLYSVGSWLFTIAWDTSFAAQTIAMTDPDGLRATLLKYIELDVREASYIVAWEAPKMNRVYLQSLFAVTKILSQYIECTGDTGILKEELNKDNVKGTTLEVLKEMYTWLYENYASEDGLLDFGGYTDQLIEIRADGYKHKVCTVNGLAAYYITFLAKWLKDAEDKDSDKFYQMGQDLAEKVDEHMWDEKGKFFASIYPDGSKQLVYSYHVFDFIESPFLSKEKREGMISHLKEKVFLGKYGMYSIARTDELHYDFEDPDFGGGGQYPGMTLQIIQSLYTLGHSEKAFDILKRCIRWCEGFPYFPQEVYAEKLAHPLSEQYIEVCAGGGAQDIIYGSFGVRINEEGECTIKPSYQKELVGSSMTDFKYRGHVYDVALEEDGFYVCVDNQEAKKFKYSESFQSN